MNSPILRVRTSPELRAALELAAAKLQDQHYPRRVTKSDVVRLALFDWLTARGWDTEVTHDDDT